MRRFFCLFFVFLLFSLFTGCAAEEPQPTQPAATTQTESTTAPTVMPTEPVLDSNVPFILPPAQLAVPDISSCDPALTKDTTSTWENGNPNRIERELYIDANTPVEIFREFYYENGSLDRQFHEIYDNGVLIEHREISNYENGTHAHTIIMQYHPSGSPLREYRLIQKEDGSITTLHDYQYNEAGDKTFYYHEQHYDNGALQMKQLKEYDEQGQLRKHEYLNYYENGAPCDVRLTEYAADGTLLKDDSIAYDAAGTITYRSQYPSEESSGFVPRVQLVYYESGNLQSSTDGLYSADTYKLMDGKSESYYENGQLSRLEEAAYDEQTRTRTASQTSYQEDGTEDFSYLWKETYDEAGNITVLDTATFIDNHTFIRHTLDRITYTADGLQETVDRTSYTESGTVEGMEYHEYGYDEQGRETYHSCASRTPDGQQTERTEFIKAYGSQNNLILEEIVSYDAADAEIHRTTFEYNDLGLLISSSTARKESVQVVTYTYDDRNRVIKELSVITPREEEADTADKETIPAEEPIIQYREIFHEYYQNGQEKTYIFHTWTSEDEKEAEPGTPQSDLGTTFIKTYDINGNQTS